MRSPAAQLPLIFCCLQVDFDVHEIAPSPALAGSGTHVLVLIVEDIDFGPQTEIYNLQLQPLHEWPAQDEHLLWSPDGSTAARIVGGTAMLYQLKHAKHLTAAKLAGDAVLAAVPASEQPVAICWAWSRACGALLVVQQLDSGRFTALLSMPGQGLNCLPAPSQCEDAQISPCSRWVLLHSRAELVCMTSEGKQVLHQCLNTLSIYHAYTVAWNPLLPLILVGEGKQARIVSLVDGRTVCSHPLSAEDDQQKLGWSRWGDALVCKGPFGMHLLIFGEHACAAGLGLLKAVWTVCGDRTF